MILSLLMNQVSSHYFSIKFAVLFFCCQLVACHATVLSVFFVAEFFHVSCTMKLRNIRRAGCVRRWTAQVMEVSEDAQLT
jgi:hypothetical protein